MSHADHGHDRTHDLDAEPGLGAPLSVMSRKEMRAMRGSGWPGDLDALRGSDVELLSRCRPGHTGVM